VLLFIEHRTRLVHLAEITARPTGERVTRQARKLLRNPNDRADRDTFLIRDRDAKFTAASDAALAAAGVPTITTPGQVPGANAIADRWIPAPAASARTGC
jgi:putative transposase